MAVRSALVLVVALLGAKALAARPGSALPEVEAKDLRGRQVTLKELQGDGPAVVLALTDPSQAEALERWSRRLSKERPELRQLGVIALDLPGLVPDALARAQARRRVPRHFWSKTMLDLTGDLREELGLDARKGPVVLLVGPDGVVRSRLVGDADERRLGLLLGALRAPFGRGTRAGTR